MFNPFGVETIKTLVVLPEEIVGYTEVKKSSANLGGSMCANSSIKMILKDDPRTAEEEVEAVEDEELEEDIFEAALRGLGVEVVNDSAARLNEVKRKVYKKVIQRLLKEAKAEKKPAATAKRKIRRRRK